jgi:hypothetical protein
MKGPCQGGYHLQLYGVEMTTKIISDLSFNLNQVSIRQDGNGLFFASDFQTAAGYGGIDSKRPGEWKKLKHTKDQIDAVHQKHQNSQRGNSPFENTPVNSVIYTIKGGRCRGTYLCMELAISYCMWLDPIFHIEVIDAFIAHSQQKIEEATAVSVAGYLYNRSLYLDKHFAKEVGRRCWVMWSDDQRELKQFDRPLEGHKGLICAKYPTRVLDQVLTDMGFPIKPA